MLVETWKSWALTFSQIASCRRYALFMWYYWTGYIRCFYFKQLCLTLSLRTNLFRMLKKTFLFGFEVIKTSQKNQDWACVNTLFKNILHFLPHHFNFKILIFFLNLPKFVTSLSRCTYNLKICTLRGCRKNKKKLHLLMSGKLKTKCH